VSAIDYASGYLMAYGARSRSSAARAKAAAGSCASRWPASPLDRRSRHGAASGVAADVPATELAGYCAEMESPIGTLRYLGPVIRLSHTPGRWSRPPVPLGTHRAEWPDRSNDMDFRLTPEQEEFREAVLRFSTKGAGGKGPRARACERLSVGCGKRMAKQGLLGITLPRPMAGRRYAARCGTRHFETVASSARAARMSWQAATSARSRAGGIWFFIQKQTYLRRLLAGESVHLVGMTEPTRDPRSPI